MSLLLAVFGLVLALSLGVAANADAFSLRRPAFGPVTSDFGARWDATTRASTSGTSASSG